MSKIKDVNLKNFGQYLDKFGQLGIFKMLINLRI